MILLDTNVISEPMRREPEARVLAWLDRQPSETLFLSAITVAEIRKGIALLPAGKRQTLLAERLDKLLLPMFHGRILPFDIHTTPAYASVIARAAAAGCTIAAADGFIAAIALQHHFSVATRDTRPFQAAELDVINPWTTD